MSLFGILIIIVGFALKLDTIAVVVSAGVVTGLVADMSISEILSTLGTAFINNRTTCLFMLTLPVIGLCERYGLKAKAIDLIKKSKRVIYWCIIKWIYIYKRSFYCYGSNTWRTSSICKTSY